MRCLKTRSSGSSELRLSRSNSSRVGLAGDGKAAAKFEAVVREFGLAAIIEEAGPDWGMGPDDDEVAGRG